jgi:hypothetical protein
MVSVVLYKQVCYELVKWDLQTRTFLIVQGVTFKDGWVIRRQYLVYAFSTS